VAFICLSAYLPDKQRSCCLYATKLIGLWWLQISAIFEYGAILKVSVEFREVSVADQPVSHFAYACECVVAGKKYPQGLGSTKKKAKTASARIAMDIILEQGLCVAGERAVMCTVHAKVIAILW